jgi:hypothetical protein
MDITKFEWEVIVRFMGASPEEIKDVQVRMGRVWKPACAEERGHDTRSRAVLASCPWLQEQFVKP